MLDDALFDLADRYGLDPEVVAELSQLLESATSAPSASPPPELVRRLGQGGTAEVWEAEDARLRRTVAVKVLRSELAAHPATRERFLREARATAQLVHPGIVPIHDIGELPGGRPFFTMAVVRGRTLDALVEDASSLRRRVSLFLRAVEAVAYAHDRGVLHRDLKPTNIMVGRFGTVFVLDWGLVGAAWIEPGAPSDPSLDMGAPLTVGVSGTPGYMSPEQRTGGQLTPASDVYALGVVLRELLGDTPPDALVAIADRATAPEPDARFADAGALGQEISRWIDGDIQREQALEQVAEASAMQAEEQAIRLEAEADRAAAAAHDVAQGASAEDHVPRWRLLDHARALEERADSLVLRRLQILHGALTLDPTCPEALGALAGHWHQVHVDAERCENVTAAREAEVQLAHLDRGQYARYLDGSGSIRLETSPPGARGTLFRLEERDRRLVPVDPRPIGPTPWVCDAVPMGSYLVELATDPVTRVPIYISRNHDWCEPPVVLLRPGSLGPDDCYVPGGRFVMGATSSPERHALPRQTVSVPGFVMRRTCVTHREYLRFLDALVDRGDEAAALRVAPRERGARPDQPGAICYGRDDGGHFHLATDADGDRWDPDYPVFLIDHHGARAYAAWWAERTDRPWRLPTEFEWEKAARGVDGRQYPWGSRFASCFACVRSSHPGRPLPATVHSYPVDCSVYGVRGLAGNVREWCDGPFHLPSARPPDGGDGQVMVRGGCWFFPARGAHLAARYGLDPTNRADTVGFRLVRDLVHEDLASGAID